MTEAFLSRAMDVYGDCIYRLALCRLQNQADAEDAFQDTFLALFQQGNAAAWEEEHLKAWLLRVAVNKCGDIARRRRRTAPLAFEELAETPGHDLYGYIDLWDAVNRLPEKQRLIFHLHYCEGYQTGEIGEILKMPGSTVRVYLNRARTALRKELGDNAEIS